MLLDTLEDWLISTIQERLDCYSNLAATHADKLDAVDVDAGPGEWDESYLKSLIEVLPAVRVVWDGAAAKDETALTLDNLYSLMVVTGWRGESEKERRRNSRNGAYRITEIIAPILHNAVARDAANKPIAQIRVDTVQNIWTGSLNRIGVAVYQIDLDVNMPLDIVEPPTKPLDDFLQAGVEYDIDQDGTTGR